MKKIIIYIISGIILLFIILAVFINLNTTKEKKLENVRLSEVAHTIFYAPQYVAIEKGYFEDYGIDTVWLSYRYRFFRKRKRIRKKE